MIRNRFIAALSGTVGLLATMPAVAQTEAPTGTHIRQPKPAEVPEDSRRSDTDVAREVTYEFGRCVVQRYPARAEAIAGQTLSPEQVDGAMRKLATPDCLRNAELRMPSMLMRGAIFRALYLRDFPRAQPALLPQPIDYRPISGELGTPGSNGFLMYMAFADCVARSQPDLSRALTVARPGTTAEDEAIAQIQPKLGACLYADTKLGFNRATLAALIAEALYRESRAAAPPATKSASR